VTLLTASLVDHFIEEKLVVFQNWKAMIRYVFWTGYGAHTLHDCIRSGCNMPLIEVGAMGENIVYKLIIIYLYIQSTLVLLRCRASVTKRILSTNICCSVPSHVSCIHFRQTKVLNIYAYLFFFQYENNYLWLLFLHNQSDNCTK
jgi:hypothetical protein